MCDDLIVKEGENYIIMKCGHCKGETNCDCEQCMREAAMEYVSSYDKEKGVRTFNTHYLEEKMREIEDDYGKVVCSVCKGNGTVIFWKSKNE